MTRWATRTVGRSSLVVTAVPRVTLPASPIGRSRWRALSRAGLSVASAWCPRGKPNRKRNLHFHAGSMRSRPREARRTIEIVAASPSPIAQIERIQRAKMRSNHVPYAQQQIAKRHASDEGEQELHQKSHLHTPAGLGTRHVPPSNATPLPFQIPPTSDVAARVLKIGPPPQVPGQRKLYHG